MKEDQDLHCEQKGAGQLPGIADLEAQALGGHAQQIHPHQRQQHAEPDLPGRAPVEKDAQQRHDDHIQRRDEARLGGRGIGDADLLGGAGRAEQDAADAAGRDQVFPLGGIPRPAVVDPAPVKEAVHHVHHRRQKRHGDPAAPGKIGEGADMLRPDALRDEGGAPEKGAQKQQKNVEFVVFHGQQRPCRKNREEPLPTAGVLLWDGGEWRTRTVDRTL